MFKKLLFFPVIMLILVFSFSDLSAEIIPLKKPLLSKEEKEQSLLKDTLKPIQKPKPKIKVKKSEIVKNKISKKLNLILPKKKTFNSRIAKTKS